MHENENVMMPDDVSVDEMSAEETTETEPVSEEVPKPKRTCEPRIF